MDKNGKDIIIDLKGLSKYAPKDKSEAKPYGGFDIGDKVQVTGGAYGITSVGSEGTIIGFDDPTGRVVIDFSKIITPHNAPVSSPSQTIFSVEPTDLKKIEGAKPEPKKAVGPKPTEVGGHKIGDKVAYQGNLEKLKGDEGTVKLFSAYHPNAMGVKWDKLGQVVWVSAKSVIPWTDAHEAPQD
jgi:hypothetical protein